jgi:tRNA(fMet)-specific endonuclease VapC
MKQLKIQTNNRPTDTCVASYPFKKHSLAQDYRPLLKGKLLDLSFMTIAELYRWAIERAWGEKKINQLQAMIQGYVVLPSDNEMCWQWAKINSIKGKPMSVGDAWIAATALHYNMPLITHNIKHFEHLKELGLNIITVQTDLD